MIRKYLLMPEAVHYVLHCFSVIFKQFQKFCNYNNLNMEGSKDVEEEEETKVTSQRAPSTRRDRGGDLKLSKVENPSSPTKESADKEDSSAPKPRRRRNEATGASTSNSGGGGGWMSTSSGANGTE